MEAVLVKKTPVVLALDLEGTLISNAVSQIARPGLFEFLVDASATFPRIVVFTTVAEEKFRVIAQRMSQEGTVPPWFVDIECVRWHGRTKDLSFVVGASVDEVLLADDFQGYVHPGQEDQWVRVEQFHHPYSLADVGLRQLFAVLESRVTRR
ncbi:hypothetical protein N799_04970 [Lysobacter arseniciresistens ZS79]|uniref:FCP1 homology domain-containing protein n=1 Tax=Lysobacter arseniciresistens ZS79 TaxID=913325 RepID=A0A0A0EYV3_9GAMM|nr:NIF family HAD-type phosphatase [Lysobacter arseniciresistens]KGM56146.1 hypothetical protein N799_04970 [Lysobacter arseniciresistens ZS79]